MKEEKGYPVDDRYYVLKQDESLGPFDVEELLEQIDVGAFSYDDVCLRVGDTECSRLREILDWDDTTELSSIEDSDKREEQTDTKEDNDLPDNPSDTPTEAPAPGSVLYLGHPSMLSQPLPTLGLVGGIIVAVWLYPVDIKFTLGAATIALLSLACISFTRYTKRILRDRSPH